MIICHKVRWHLNTEAKRQRFSHLGAVLWASSDESLNYAGIDLHTINVRQLSSWVIMLGCWSSENLPAISIRLIEDKEADILHSSSVTVLHIQIQRWTKIYLEEIISSHSRLPGYSSWNDDHITALQGLSKLIITSIALQIKRLHPAWEIASIWTSSAMIAWSCTYAGHDSKKVLYALPYLCHRLCVDVTDICSNSWGSRNIIERQIVYIGVHLHQYVVTIHSLEMGKANRFCCYQVMGKSFARSLQ